MEWLIKCQKHLPQKVHGNIFLCDARVFLLLLAELLLLRVVTMEAVDVVRLLGVIGGDGGVLLKRSVSSEDDRPESLETEIRSSINNGEMEGILEELIWIESKGRDRSNGESVK